jgi:hypothetical protein
MYLHGNSMSVHALSDEVYAMQTFVARFIFYHGERMPDANEVVMNYHTKIDIYRYYQKKASDKDFYNRYARKNQEYLASGPIREQNGGSDMEIDLGNLSLNPDVSNMV